MTLSWSAAYQLNRMGAALFYVPRAIAHLLPRGLAHEYVCPERRQSAILGFFNHRLVAGDILGSGVLADDIFESCLFQKRWSLGWRPALRSFQLTNQAIDSNQNSESDVHPQQRKEH